MKYSKTIFNSTDWDLLTQNSSTNDSYNIFFQKFIKIYDQTFPERKNEMKQKSLSSPWISKVLIVKKETASIRKSFKTEN